jgi:tripartite-type tricarboxylate transporter receptor subunit TctC
MNNRLFDIPDQIVDYFLKCNRQRHAKSRTAEGKGRDIVEMKYSQETSRLARVAAVIAGSLVLASIGSTPVKAQPAWPQRPVTMIVSQSAGASPDVFARLLSEKLHAVLKQPVIVDNKPGAGNAIGAQAAARATPDGQTFFFATSAAMSMNPFLMKNLPYDPLKDFIPIALVTRSHQVLVAHPDVPANTLPEMIALVKKDPGKYAIAVDGPRNLSGVIVRVLKLRAGIDLNEIPYTNIAASMQDVLVGRVPFGLYSLSVAESMIRAGKLKVIANASSQKISTMEDVTPIAREFPGFDFLGWFMVVAPVGTPEPILDEMHRAVSIAIKDPAVQSLGPKLGFDIDPKGVGTRADARLFLQQQLDLWSRTTRELGLQPE